MWTFCSSNFPRRFSSDKTSFRIFSDEKEMKYYRDGIRQSIELYGTPSCKQRFNSSVKSTWILFLLEKKFLFRLMLRVLLIFHKLKNLRIQKSRRSEICFHISSKITSKWVETISAILDPFYRWNLRFEVFFRTPLKWRSSWIVRQWIRRELFQRWSSLLRHWFFRPERLERTTENSRTSLSIDCFTIIFKVSWISSRDR